MPGLYSHRQAFALGVRQVVSGPLMAAASCLGIGVALALPLLLYLALDNLRGVGDVWSESGGVTVFLSHDIAPAAEQRVLKTVAETEGVGQVRHYSQGQHSRNSPAGRAMRIF